MNKDTTKLIRVPADVWRQVVEALGDIDRASPPDTWEYYDGLCGYQGWREFEQDAADHVDSPDESNSGDMLSFGMDVGRWHVARILRPILEAAKKVEAGDA
jgi:hypothetical protein